MEKLPACPDMLTVTTIHVSRSIEMFTSVLKMAQWLIIGERLES